MIRRKLKDVASVIRSKNAGPLLLTLDVILPDKATFDQVVAAGGFRHAMAQVTFSLGRQDGSVPKVQLLPVFCRRIRADTELHRADIGVEGLR